MAELAKKNKEMSALEWGLLIALSVLWGGSFFFNGVAVRELPTLTVVVCRVVLAALTLLLVLRAMGQRMPRAPEVWVAFVTMGVLNNVVPFTLIVWGQAQTGAGVASILNATTPLFTVLVAHVFTADEKLTGLRIAGVLLGLGGVAVMMGGAGVPGEGAPLVAYIACLAGAFSYACAGVFGRRFRALGVTPIATAAGQLIAASIVLIPLMALVDRPWHLPMPSAGAIAALVAVAVLSSALAYIIYFRILSTAGATNLLLVTLLLPVTAILLGVGILGEALLARHLLGMAIIGLGLAAIDGRPVHAIRRAFS